MSGQSALSAVVELNEGIKVVSSQSHAIGLRALDAVVRSTQAGASLRGFVVVASQMREWSRELHAVVQKIAVLSAARVEAVSAQLRHARTRGLLEYASASAAGSPLKAAFSRIDGQHQALDERLRSLHRDTRHALEELGQLGLMASVLSRAALIEAASGDRDDLSEVACEFAKSAERVMTIVHDMLKHNRENQP